MTKTEFPSFAITETNLRKRPSERRDRSYYAAPRVYVNVDGGNDDILGDMRSGRRRNRPEQILRPLVQEFVRTYVPGATVRWSQKAGCGCGCSPAFIVKAPDSGYNGAHGALECADLFLSVTTNVEVAA